MKYLSMIFAIATLVAASPLLADEDGSTGCSCSECPCTSESHCGCYSEEGCQCSPDGLCAQDQAISKTITQSNCGHGGGCGCGRRK